MHVPLGANHAFFQLDDAAGPDQHAAGRAGDFAAGAHRQVDAQRDAVGEGQFDLAEGRSVRAIAPTAASAAWARRPSRFPRRRKSRLDRGALYGVELVAGAEQGFDVLVGQMHMPRGDADDQFRSNIGGSGALNRSLTVDARQFAQHDLADDPFDGGTI